jgi:hypothetical protein
LQSRLRPERNPRGTQTNHFPTAPHLCHILADWRFSPGRPFGSSAIPLPPFVPPARRLAPCLPRAPKSQATASRHRSHGDGRSRRRPALPLPAAHPGRQRTRDRSQPPSIKEFIAALSKVRSMTPAQHRALLDTLAACGWTRERLLAPWSNFPPRRGLGEGTAPDELRERSGRPAAPAGRRA